MCTDFSYAFRDEMKSLPIILTVIYLFMISMASDPRYVESL